MRFVAHAQRDDDVAERVGDQRQKMANGVIGKNITLAPCGQPCLDDRQVKRLLPSHYLPLFGWAQMEWLEQRFQRGPDVRKSVGELQAI
jgi:hypothetical protein